MSFILALCTILASAQVKVLGKIEPNGADDTYPTHVDSLGRGGLIAVGTWQERNSIPRPRRKAGMLVRVKSSTVDSTYTIGRDLNNADWIPFAPVTGYATLSGSNLFTGVNNRFHWGVAVSGNTGEGINFYDNNNNYGVRLFRPTGDNNTLAIKPQGSSYIGALKVPALSSDLTWTFPSTSGTLATVADIPAPVDISGKANLAGGNTFTGTQLLDTISVKPSASTPYKIFGSKTGSGPNASAALVISRNGSDTPDNIGTAPFSISRNMVTVNSLWIKNRPTIVSGNVYRARDVDSIANLKASLTGGNTFVGNQSIMGNVNANQVTVLRDGIDGATINDGITVFKPDGLGENAIIGTRMYRGDITTTGNVGIGLNPNEYFVDEALVVNGNAKIKTAYGDVTIQGDDGANEIPVITSPKGIAFSANNESEGSFLLITPNNPIQFNNDIILDKISSGIILRSPNGSKWRITVSDTGVLSTTAVTP